MDEVWTGERYAGMVFFFLRNTCQHGRQVTNLVPTAPPLLSEKMFRYLSVLEEK